MFKMYLSTIKNLPDLNSQLSKMLSHTFWYAQQPAI